MRLCGSDLAVLRRLVAALEGHEESVASHWERCYALAFPGRGYHPPGEFRSVALEEIRTIFKFIREGDMPGLSDSFEERGRELFAQGVPFAEVVRSLHLFEESIVQTLRREGISDEEVIELFQGFDALSHERIILLAESYHSRCRATWVQREEKVISGVARREREQSGRDRLCGLVGVSDPMQRVYERLTLAAGSRDAVLITGGTGTGKELAARTIHALSGDAAEAFVPVNCAAISHDLIESELFGHRRGAFSGAHADHAGLFRAAHGGTLFLDEVTELPVTAQAKLLRALQERAVRPVGGLTEIPVDLRIVASTNRNVEEALGEGRIRRDFYYRLRHLVIALPPLAGRGEDISLLSEHFAKRAASDGLCARAPAFTQAALLRLMAQPWPGNIRELESVVRLACRLAGTGPIDVKHLTDDALSGGAATEPAAAGIAAVSEPVSIRDAERAVIARALKSTEGNKTRAASLLGISRKQLYVKIRQYGLV